MAATAMSSLILSARRSLNEMYTLVRPNAPLVSAQGTTGATTYTYVIVARNSTGTTEASPSTSITNGNASLSGTNFNQLTWTAVPYADSYDVYRTVGGATTGKIVSATTSLTANDTGLAGGSETAPTTNTSGVTNAFWTDTELLDYLTRGITDLWASVMDLHQEHFFTIDESSLSISANTATISGVPSDMFRVGRIEPVDMTSTGSYRNLQFVPRDYNHPDFVQARATENQDPSSGDVIVYYTITGAGTPTGAPTIRIAPKLTTAIAAGGLRLAYVPNLSVSAYTTATTNPIPGESDNALIAWTVAFARAKERDDRSPDPAWLSIYSTEKQTLLTRLTPRQTQEPDYVEGIFEGLW